MKSIREVYKGIHQISMRIHEIYKRRLEGDPQIYKEFYLNYHVVLSNYIKGIHEIYKGVL